MARVLNALVLGLAIATLVGGALAQEEARHTERHVTPMEYNVAVFLFANQSYDPSLEYLQTGMRDLIAQTMALHHQVEVVDPLRLDRSIRRAGFNPRRAIAYGEAADIARELEADRAISGTLTQRGDQVIVQAQMVLLEDMNYQWTPEFSLTLEGDPVTVGIELAKFLLSRLPVDADEVAPEFLVGSHVTVEISSNAPEVALRLVNPAEEATLSLRGYKVISGKTLGSITWDSESRTLFIATAPDTSSPDWTVELDAVVTCTAESLRLAMGATAGSRADLKITNQNLLGEARVAKTFSIAADTPRADVLVSGEAIARDAPVFLLAMPFEAMDGSLPLHQAAEAPAEESGTEEPTEPPTEETPA